MTTSTQASDQTRPQGNIPLLSIGAILLMFAWPAAWYTLLIYGSKRLFIPNNSTIRPGSI